MAHIEIRKEGRDRVRRIALGDQPCTLGRSSSNKVALTDYSISRHHCVIERAGDSFCVRDLDSRHGLKVNHVRVKESSLKEGDVVRVGPYELTFRTANPADAVIGLASDDSGDDWREASHAGEASGEFEAATSAHAAEVQRLKADIERLQSTVSDREVTTKANKSDEQSRAAAARIADLERQVAAGANLIDQWRQKAERAETSRDGVQRDLAREREELARLRETSKDAGAALAATESLRSRVSDLEREKAVLTDSLRARQSDLDRQQDAATGDRDRLAAMTATMAELQRRAAEAMEGLQELQAHLNESETSRAAALAELGAERVRADRLAGSDAALIEAQEDIDRLRATMSRFESERTAAAAETADLRRETAGLVDLRSRLEAAQAEAIQARNDAARNAGTAELAATAAASAEAATAEIAALRDRADLAERRCSELSSQLAADRERLSASEATRRELDDVCSDRDAVKRELEALQSDRQALLGKSAQDHDALAAAHGERDRLVERVANIETTLLLARKTVDQSEARARSAEGLLAEVSPRLAESERTIADLRSETERLAADRARLEALLSSAREESGSIAAAAEAARDEAAALVAARDDLAARLERGQREHETDAAELAALRDSYEELSRRLAAETSGEAVQMRIAELAEANRKSDEAVSERDSLMRQNVTLAAEHDRLAAERQVHVGERAALQSEREALIAERDMAQSRAASLDQSSREAEWAKAAAERDLASLRAEWHAQSAQLESIRAAKGQASRDVDELRARLEAAETGWTEALAALEETGRLHAAADSEAETKAERNGAAAAEMEALIARAQRLELEAQDAVERQRRAERQAALAAQARDEFKQRLAEVESSRALLLTKAKTALGELEITRRDLAQSRLELRESQTLLIKQLLNLEGTEDVETSIVDMTPEQLAQARAEGATILELRMPGPS